MTSLENIAPQLPFCVDAYTGNLFGRPALLVTTGIGHDNSTMCMLNVLQVFHIPPQSTIREVVFLGTSGWSSRPGGILTAPGCTAQGPDTIIPGDICVSAATTNWDCQQCTWNSSVSPDVCQYPSCSGHFETAHFNGGCNSWGDTTLAAEVVHAAKAANLPTVNDVLRGLVSKYWDSMSRGTGVQYQTRNAPQVFDYHQCAEAGSYTYWLGLPYEMSCRQYTAAAIAASVPRNEPQKPVICVSAMEAPGWMSVLVRAAQARGQKIPFVNVRSASDYAHRPLYQSNGLWVEDGSWITPGEAMNMTIEGYHYAVRTSSEIVLSLYRQRT
eukprot:TRINITY_DN31008_c0_g1_i1.p1 TRINITY_DN31008_c0_g1~~TRINITY_DN31008_c0_g1_i1.p1  ORF type:complete len:378 (+),score=40.13 TRINITY_DN31008_c0_g1_i1:156-1136(+)